MNEEQEKHITPLKSIRLKCLDCCCNSPSEVALCPCEDCPLWEFRFGKNPNIKLSDEERERRSRMARENLAFTNNVRGAKVVADGD